MKARPWEAPGYVFFTPAMRAWLHGYVPVLAAEMAAAAAFRAKGAATREANLKAGQDLLRGKPAAQRPYQERA